MDNNKVASIAPPTLKRALDSDPVITQQPPPAKRRRGTEIPMWARQASGTAPLPKYRGVTATNGGTLPPRPNIGTTAASALHRPEAHVTTPMNIEPPMTLEASFKDEQPFEDVHKAVCDFLFGAVVQNLNFDTTRSALGELEIEAKLGTIIDRNTNERLRLPTLSEAVLPEGYHVAFESMMTEVSRSSLTVVGRDQPLICHSSKSTASSTALSMMPLLNLLVWDVHRASLAPRSNMFTDMRSTHFMLYHKKKYRVSHPRSFPSSTTEGLKYASPKI